MKNLFSVLALIGALVLPTAAISGERERVDFRSHAFNSGLEAEVEVSTQAVVVNRTPGWVKFVAATLGVSLVGYLGYRLGGSRAYNSCSGNLNDATGGGVSSSDRTLICDAVFDR